MISLWLMNDMTSMKKKNHEILIPFQVRIYIL